MTVSEPVLARKHASAFFGVGKHSGRSHRWDGPLRCGRSRRAQLRPNGRTRVRGVVFLNNRYHDPTTGTFLSVDPLVAVTGQAYLYGNGNPTTFSDPSGLDPDTDARVRATAKSNGRCTYSAAHSAAAAGNVCGGSDGVYYGHVSRPKAGTGKLKDPSPSQDRYQYCADFDQSGGSCWGEVEGVDPPSNAGRAEFLGIVAGPLLDEASTDAFFDGLCLLGMNFCGNSGRKSPTSIDALAGGELLAFSDPTAVYGCGTSAGGAAITCVDAQVMPSMQPADAVTYGHYVFCNGSCHDYKRSLLAHEFVHVNQYEVNGDQMAVSYLADLVRNGGYGGSSYEREAYNTQGFVKSVWGAA
jgi:RHS repeat-associated protein